MRTVALLASALAAAGCGGSHPGGASMMPATSPQKLTSDRQSDVPSWIRGERLPAKARPGARLFARLPCLSCHRYLGSGTRNLGAPNLTAEGERGRGVAWQIAHLRCPSCVVASSPMPPFGNLPRPVLRRLALFLEASQGPAR